MKKRVLLFLGWITCIVFAVIIVTQYRVKKDGPEITTVQSEIKYSRKTKEEELLKICRASDRQDGEVELQIETVQKLKDNNVRVVYFAMDSDYNITKKSIFISNGKVTDTLKDIESSEENESSELETEVETESETEKSLSVNERLLAVSDYEEALEIMQSEDADFQSGCPVIVLKQDEYEIQAGDSFAGTEFIEEIWDNYDDRNTLWSRINMSSNHDVNVPGEYEVQFWLSDLDRNQSNRAVLKLIVS